MAYRLVETAQQNFLENRHVTEVSAIAETISILEVHASSVRETIDQALERVQSLQDPKKRAAARAAASASAPKAAPAPGGTLAAASAANAAPKANEEELMQLKSIIREKRRLITDLEEQRQRRLTELNHQLTEAKVIYSDQHPVIIDTQQRIDQLKKESPQVTALKNDEAALLAEYERKGGKDVNALVEPRRRTRVAGATETELLPATSAEDPEFELANHDLRMATAKYEDLLMRIDATRIELDTARAAFKYRYSVINPPQLPKKPIKPNVPLLIFGALFGAVVLGLLAGPVKDLLRGRIVEGWQVERWLNLPLLAEVKRTPTLAELRRKA
jgi:hypothetical protein